MLALTVRLEGDGAFPDLRNKEVIHLANNAPPIQIAALEGGMTSGAPSIVIRVDLPDGRVVMAETSLRLFQGANNVLRARYGDVS